MLTTPPLVSAVGGKVRALRALYPLVSEDAPVVDIHVAMEGSWEGHPSGPFSLTADDFANIVAAFEANPNPIPLDTEHSTTWATEAPAVGWVHHLEVRKDDSGVAHLWAKAELGEKAAGWVKAGEYRFSSGVFEFDAIDPESGKNVGTVLSSVALTNVPFLRGQTPIALSMRAARRALSSGDRMQKLTKEALLAALDQFESDEIDMEQLEAAAHLAAVKDGGSEGVGPEAPMADKDEDDPKGKDAFMDEGDDKDAKLSEEPEAPVEASEEPADEVEASEEQPPVAAADEPGAEGGGDEAMAALAPLMEATGLDAAGLAAAIQEHMDAVVSALSGALQEPAADAPLSAQVKELSLRVKAGDEAIKALSQRAEKAEAELSKRAQQDAEREVDTLIAEGRVTDNLRDDFVQLALSDRPRFDRIAASMPQVVPLGKHAAGVEGPKGNKAEPLNEDDPTVKSFRRTLSAAGIPRELQDEKIRARLAARN